jgi:hypothetical protein
MDEDGSLRNRSLPLFLFWEYLAVKPSAPEMSPVEALIPSPGGRPVAL